MLHVAFLGPGCKLHMLCSDFDFRCLAALLVISVGGITFQLHQHDEKCVQLDLLQGAVVQANYSISPELNDGKVFNRV